MSHFDNVGNRTAATNNFGYYKNDLLQFAGNASGTASLSYDIVNRLTNVVCVGPNGAVAYTYYPAGNVSNMSSVAGTSGYAYDEAERLSSLTASRSGLALLKFNYAYSETNGAIWQVACTNNGVTASNSFDVVDRVSSIAYRNSTGGVVRSLAYAYNNASMITNVTREGGVQTVYGYDDLDRLTSVSSGASVVQYSFDAVGNRTQTVVNGSATSWQVNNANRLTNWGSGTAALYDSAGNATSLVFSATSRLDLAWDGKYQLSQIRTNGAVAERYGRDAFGRRVWTWTSGQSTNWHVYNGAHIVADVNAAGGLVRTYTWGSAIDDLLAITVYTGAVAQTYFAIKDHLGSVHALVNGSGQVFESYAFDAWGKVLEVRDSSGALIPRSSVGNRYLWQGREYSWDTGLYDFRFRHYSPTLGRFISPDPISLYGGLNLYEFCGNDPIGNIDPFVANQGHALIMDIDVGWQG